MKTCTKCKIEKEFSEFYKDKKGKDGLHTQCKPCNDGQKKIYRLTHKRERSTYEKNQNLLNPEWKKKKAEFNAKYYKKLKETDSIVLKNMREFSKNFNKVYRKDNPTYFLLKAAKSRAKKQNLPFNLELEDIIIPAYCPILEIELFTNKEKSCNNSPSLDKIIPNLGYVKGNIKVISHLANSMKNSADFDLLQKFSKNIMNYINNKDIVRPIEKSIEVKDKEPLR